MYELDRTAIIPAPREEVFAFFEDPRNLARITPKSMNFTIHAIDDLPLKEGFRIEYRIKWMGVSLPWVTHIDEYVPGERFADTQTKGPYKYWRHEHTFQDLSNGQTLMRDRVEYEMPFGPIGTIGHRFVVAGQLKRIFDFRARRIRKYFVAADARPKVPSAGTA